MLGRALVLARRGWGLGEVWVLTWGVLARLKLKSGRGPGSAWALARLKLKSGLWPDLA